MITQARLQELLDYDPSTGVFTWKARRGPSAPAGAIAGHVSKAKNDQGGGYRWIGVDGSQCLAHRLAWLYVTGRDPADQIDHRNAVRDDNRFDNLREASRVENLGNRPLYANNKTGFKGVSFNKKTGKFVASIQRDGNYEYLGLFQTAEAAHQAYLSAANRLFGEFARAS